MTKRVPITQFVPLEFARFRDSESVRLMDETQRAWYIYLIGEGWLNTSRPCHVRNSEELLWSYAGARTKQYFQRHGKCVTSQFRACCGGAWLCNVESLRLYLEKLKTYFQQKIPPETLLFIFNSCTCLSKEEKERLRGNDGRNIDTEQLARSIRAIGFRDSQAISVEHAIVNELSSGDGNSAELLAALKRIFHWTENGVYAPRLHEVIRRWKEPQHLWERKNVADKRNPIWTMGYRVGGLPKDHVYCATCKRDLGLRHAEDAKDDVFVCSDECAAKSGYEVAQ